MNKTNEGPSPTKFLRDAFATEQSCIMSLLESSSRIVHAGDRGEVNEHYFIDFLRKYLPNRYTVEKASVIDSKGRVSQSIDIVVFDRQYTPTLLDSDKHRYVPAEAVYAIFECKPTIDKGYLEYAANKAASVRTLHRTSVDIYTASGRIPAKEHFPIVAGILAINVDWSGGLSSEAFQRTHAGLSGDQQLDCGFSAAGACFDIFDGPASYCFGPTENSLAFFAFRLLSKLQSMATVPAVDWMAYANRLGGREPSSSNV